MGQMKCQSLPCVEYEIGNAEENITGIDEFTPSATATYWW